MFISLADPTGPMRKEAVKAGFYETLYGKYPESQILTNARLGGREATEHPAGGHARPSRGPAKRRGGSRPTAILSGDSPYPTRRQTR